VSQLQTSCPGLDILKKKKKSGVYKKWLLSRAQYGGSNFREN
jgi:hypothetical protein